VLSRNTLRLFRLIVWARFQIALRWLLLWLALLALFALHCAFVVCYPRCVGFRSMAARWASARLPGFSLASQEHGVGAGVLAYPGPSPNFGFKKLLPT